MLDPRVRRTLPLAAVLAVVLAGLVLVGSDHWRRGAALFATAALLAAVLRLLVPDRWTGLLAIRSRPFDIAFLLGLAALFGLAVTRP